MGCDFDDANDEKLLFLQQTVTNMILEVLARLSLHPKIFEQLLTNLLSLFFVKPMVLHKKGKLIITKLCALLDCTQIYSLLGNLILQKYANPNGNAHASKQRHFVRNMVRLMNLILLTSKELYPLRQIIKKANGDKHIFFVLYKTWCCSPISLVSLCLLAQRYDVGLMLVNQFKEDTFVHKSVQFLLEIDELIHLLESPIFLHLRLQLLCLDADLNENKENEQLFQIVNGLLTLLPHSDAFHQFRVRIQMISLHKRLFSKLAKKSNRKEPLVDDKRLRNAMYYDKMSANDDKKLQMDPSLDKDKLFQLYLDTQTRMHTAL